jgi:hypothetical protein
MITQFYTWGWHDAPNDRTYAAIRKEKADAKEGTIIMLRISDISGLITTEHYTIHSITYTNAELSPERYRLHFVIEGNDRGMYFAGVTISSAEEFLRAWETV